MQEGDSLVKLSCDIPLPTKVILLKTVHFRSGSANHFLKQLTKLEYLVILFFSQR